MKNSIKVFLFMFRLGSLFDGSRIEGEERLGIKQYKDSIPKHPGAEVKSTAEQQAPLVFFVCIISGFLMGYLIKMGLTEDNVGGLMGLLVLAWGGWRGIKKGIIGGKNEEIIYWKKHFLEYFDRTQELINANK